MYHHDAADILYFKWTLLGMIAYVLMNVVCGNFKKITPAMYILAVLFILKFIFI